jgi:hypothetical protein
MPKQGVATVLDVVAGPQPAVAAQVSDAAAVRQEAAGAEPGEAGRPQVAGQAA